MNDFALTLLFTAHFSRDVYNVRISIRFKRTKIGSPDYIRLSDRYRAYEDRTYSILRRLPSVYVHSKYVFPAPPPAAPGRPIYEARPGR